MGMDNNGMGYDNGMGFDNGTGYDEFGNEQGFN